ncbi:MAG: hypothetical protein K8S14_11180, partial [Actinomycetia bacterium]|nr:hypothetical protein [Actinomycetes bacterium]
MNKKQFITDMKVGDSTDSTFIISDKQAKKKKNGEDYCTVTLQDRTGTIEGILWTEVFLEAGDFSEGDLVSIKSVIREYRGSKQLIVNSLKKLAKDD